MDHTEGERCEHPKCCLGLVEFPSTAMVCILKTNLLIQLTIATLSGG